MEKRLIKILEGNADVSKLTENNIEEFVQTKQTIDRLNKFAIQPFEEIAKERIQTLGEHNKLFYGADMIFGVKTTSSPKHYTAKEILALTQAVIGTSLQNNELGKQMYGVRRFDGTPAIDATYLLGLVLDWQNAVIGENIRQTISCEADTQSIARQYGGMTALIDKPIITSPTGFSHEAGALYLTSKGQVKDLTERVVKPFETAFKEMSTKDPDQTTRDYHNYGGLSVFVKTVPRSEPDFIRALGGITESLEYFARLKGESASPIAFFNDAIRNPTTYVALEGLLDLMKKEQSKTETKFRQEISVLYQPESARVIAR